MLSTARNEPMFVRSSSAQVFSRVLKSRRIIVEVCVVTTDSWYLASVEVISCLQKVTMLGYKIIPRLKGGLPKRIKVSLFVPVWRGQTDISSKETNCEKF